MKKKIGIIGSTGSIGKSLIKIIKPKYTDIIFLSANKNYKKLFTQAKNFKVKNLIITDYSSYKNAIKLNNKRFKIFNNFNELNKFIPNKLDYVMSSITGIDGLLPTLKIIKFTKTIAIANKETIICAWPIIKNELKRNSTKFIPVDSEHFSLWTEIKNFNLDLIRKIYLTASGGPLLKHNTKNFNKIDQSYILKHPKWKMGKKISVDSATMMNKLFEVMEAKNIFDLRYDQIDILIHPESYIHALVEYKNGIFKAVFHDTTMKIPIFNTLYSNNEFNYPKTNINLKKLNNLELQKVMLSKYRIIKYLKKLPNKHSLFDTVIIAINDTLVNKYLEKKITFNDISYLFLKFIDDKKYKIYKKMHPKNIHEIISLNRKIKKNLSVLLS